MEAHFYIFMCFEVTHVISIPISLAKPTDMITLNIKSPKEGEACHMRPEGGWH